MDNALVLTRTAAGEAAVSQPTRIVQRNLRTALMLIDGRRQVADVVARFGDIAVGEAALADLLRAGLIEPAAAGEPRAATAPAGSAVMTMSGTGELPSQITDADPRFAAGRVETINIGDLDPGAGPTPAMPGAKSRAARPLAPRTVTLPPAPAEAPAKPRPRRSLRAMRPATRRVWASTALALLMLIGLSLVAGLRYYPYQKHVPQIERYLTAALGQPVRIGAMGVSFAPYPSIALDAVEIGAARRIRVAAVRFLPDPLSLLGERIAVRNLNLTGIELAVSDIEVLTRLLSAGGGAGIVAGGLRFSDTTLRFSDTVLTGLHGETGARSGVLRFATGDGGLGGEIDAAEGGLRLRLSSAGAWAPDFLAPLVVDRFEAEGRIERDALELEKVYARLADGSVNGRARVRFGDVTRINAELEMKHVSLDKLLALSKADALAQGSASGLLTVGGPASSGGGLVFEGSMTVHNGSLQGFDLVEAVRSANGATVRGGSTRFEEFAGQVRIDGQSWRISRLRLQSGLLSAEGQVAAGRDRKVAGLLNVELRGSASSLRVPVAVSGSLREPVLGASRGTAAAPAPEPS